MAQRLGSAHPWVVPVATLHAQRNLVAAEPSAGASLHAKAVLEHLSPVAMAKGQSETESPDISSKRVARRLDMQRGNE